MKKVRVMGKRLLCLLFVVVFSMSTPMQVLAAEPLPEGYEGSNDYQIDDPEQITGDEMDEILANSQVFVPEQKSEDNKNTENKEAVAENFDDVHQDKPATAFAVLNDVPDEAQVTLVPSITANGKNINVNSITASYSVNTTDAVSDIAYYVDELKADESPIEVPQENITRGEDSTSWTISVDASTLTTNQLHKIVFIYKISYEDVADSSEEDKTDSSEGTDDTDLNEKNSPEDASTTKTVEKTVVSPNFALHKVSKGEKIKDITRKYGESATKLKEDNSISFFGVSKGSILYISAPVKLVEKSFKTTWTDEMFAAYKYMGETVGTEFAYGNINLSNGSLLYTDTDISITEQASFDIARTFHSGETEFYGYFGWGVTSIFDIALIEKDNGKLVLFLDDGRTVDFEDETQYSYAEIKDESDITTGYKVTDVQGNFWSFDLEGALVSMGDKKGQFFTLNYDEAGQLCGLATRGGKTFEIVTDELGRITGIIKPDDSSIKYEYSESTGCLKNVFNENDKKTTYEYDANKRLLSSTNPVIKPITVAYNDQSQVVTYTDAAGNTTEFTYVSADGKVTTTFKDPKGQTNSYVSNNLQQTEEFIYADGKKETKTYDKWGNLLKYVDKIGAEYSYTYDAANHMLSSSKPSNTKADGAKTTVTINYTYDSLGNLLSETDEKGNLTTYSYDQYCNPKEIINPDGSKVSYEFDDKNRMTKSVTAAGAVTSYTYENETSYNIASTTDPNNVVTTNTYDAVGRILTSECDGKTTKYEYSKTGKLLKKTNSDNTTESYVYDDIDRNISVTDAKGNTVKMTYDELGHIKELENANGSKVFYEYDKNGNLVKEIDENKQETVYTYDANDEIKSQKVTGKASVEYERDSLGRVTKETDEAGRTITYKYNDLDLITEQTDKHNRTVKYEYDKVGNLLKEIRPDKKEIIYEYDSMNRMTKKVDEKGVTTTYTYNGDGLITEKKEASGTSSRTIKYEYDSNGNKTSETDFADNKTLFEYDSFNRLTKVTDALGHSTTYTYGDLGQVATETDRTGHTKRYTYDGAGNMTKLVDANGNVFEYTYNANGQVTKETKPGGITQGAVYDESGRLAKQIDCFSQVVEYKYDTDGNLIESIDKAGNSSTYAYDLYKNKISSKDALGRETKYTYNALGWLVKEVDPAGKQTLYAYDVMGNILYKEYSDGTRDSIEYDSKGNVAKETTRTGIVTTYTYDDFSNVLSYSSTNGESVSYTYNANGKVLTQENEKGVKTTFTYDANGNVLTAIETAGEKTLASTSYTYDGNGQPLTITDALGQTTSMEYDGNGNITKTTTPDGKSQVMSYDAFGNLVSKTDKEGNTTTYAYNGLGQLISTTTPEGNTTKMGYDKCGNQAYTEDPLGNITSYSYDKVGNLIEQKDPKGGVITYTYNELNLITEEKNQEGAIKKYTYDDRTNLIKTQFDNGVVVESEYDAKDQVVKTVDGHGIIVHSTYDDRGNLLSSKEEGRDLGDREIKYTYDKFNRLIKQEQDGQETISYTYDVKDRVISETQGTRKTTYTYDSLDRVLTSTASNGVVTKYTYDSNNNVTQQEVGDVVTSFVYDGNGNLLSTTSPEGIKISREYNKDGKVVKESDGKGNYTCYQYDRAGNVVSITDREGNSSHYVYDANGNLTAMTDTNDVTARYEYDVMNRLVKVSEPDKVFVFYKYDKSGNMIEEITCDEEVDYSLLTGKSSKKLVKYNYSKTGELLSVVSADTSAEEYEYYNDGSLKKTIYPSGKTKTIKYDEFGNATKVYLEEELNASYEYDTYGQLVSLEDINGITKYQYDDFGQISEITTVGKTIKYDYDNLGRLTTLTYPDGRESTYTYDKDSKILTMSEVDGTKITYEYDANGNVLTETRSDGITTKTDYDKLDRVVKIETFKGDELETSNIYTYDASGRMSSEETKDSLGTLEKTYTYSEAGKLTAVSEVNPKDNSTTTTTYSYDTYGNRSKEKIEATGKDTVEYTYKYDAADRLDSKSVDGKEVATYEYDKDGNLTKKTEEGHTYTYTYTVDNMMATSSTDGILTSAVTYDGNGLKTFELLRKTYVSPDEFTVDGGVSEKTTKKKLKQNDKALKAWEEYYNSIDEVETALSGLTEDKTILEDAVVGIDYNEVARTYAYAQTVMAPTLADEWMAFANSFATEIVEQIETLIPGLDISDLQRADDATRDAIENIMEGLRKSKYKTTKKKVKNPDAIDSVLTEKAYYEPTNYVYDLTQQNAQVLAEYRSTGSTAAETYSYGALGRTSGDMAGVYLYDGRGSVVETIVGTVVAKTPAASTASARVATTYRYDAYGNITVGAPAQSRVYAYNGEQYTAQTGLIYLRARNYDSATGTFTTRDTYLGSQSSPVTRNRYTYGNNNPIGYQDPSGHAGIFSTIKNAAKSVTTAVTKTVSKAASTVTKAVTSTAKAVASTASNVVKAAASTAKTVTTAVKTTVNKVTTAVKTTVTNTVNTVKNVATKTVNAVVSTAKNVYNTAKTTVSNVVNTVGMVYKDVANGVIAAVNQTIDNVCTIAPALYHYVSDKVQAAETFINDPWEGFKDSFEADLDLIITGRNIIAADIQAAGEWWHSTGLRDKLTEKAEQISTAYKNSPIGKIATAVSTSVQKEAEILKEKFDNSSVGKFCKETVTSVATFYNEHKTAINIAIGVTIIAALAIATVVFPPCSAGLAIAVNALPTAIAFGAVGTAQGALDGAIEYYQEHGTIDGAGKKILESASTGFAVGTFTGAVMGGIQGAYNFKTGKAPHCFVAGTIVVTALGMMTIESIQPGDYVLAKDVDTGVVSYQAVLQTFENEIDVTYTISLEDEEIETTAGHPFYVEDEGFVQAQYLEAGDKIETADGESAEVESVKKNEHDEPVIIYNFEVMDDHTYYVGENSLLVHNTGSCGGDVPDALENGNSTNKMFGENGAQVESKTVWQNGKTERIDIENPAPGERPGQIHYHESNNTKWYLDPQKMQLYNQKTGELAPKSIQKLLKNNDVIKSIQKGLKILGE